MPFVDTAFVQPCKPTSYGGYPAAAATRIARAHVLVETSDAKSPPSNTYGSEEGVYSPGGAGDGHVRRSASPSAASTSYSHMSM